MPALRRIVAAVAVLGSLGLAPAEVVDLRVDATPQPQLAMYSGNDFSGSPYLARDGSLDSPVLAATARFDLVTLDVEPWSHYRADVLDSLRRANPRIRLLALLRGANAWSGPADSLRTVFGAGGRDYWTVLYEAIASSPRGLIRTVGGKYGTCCANVNLADPEIARLFADVVIRQVIDTRLWDGIFLDHFCPNIAWQEASHDRIDYEKAGHPDSASFFAAYQEGHRAVVQRLREHAPAGFELHGNCGPGAEGFDGWMVENFPRQNGGTWERNVQIAREGWISSKSRLPYPSVDDQTWRKIRFGLGSACLVDAVGVLAGTAWDPLRGFAPWWADEYAVDAEGRSSSQLADKHWLGPAIGPAIQLDGAWVRDFANGLVVVNPSTEVRHVRLPDGCRFIRGFHDTRANPGGPVGPTLEIGPTDARFLLKP